MVYGGGTYLPYDQSKASPFLFFGEVLVWRRKACREGGANMLTRSCRSQDGARLDCRRRCKGLRRHSSRYLTSRHRTRLKVVVATCFVLCLVRFPTCSSFLHGELPSLPKVEKVSFNDVYAWCAAFDQIPRRARRARHFLASSLSSNFADGESTRVPRSSTRRSDFVQEVLDLQDSAMAMIRQNNSEKAYGILKEVVKRLDHRECDESARLVLSRAVDDIVQTLCRRAFRLHPNSGSVLLAVNALQLQLSSTRKLSAHYSGVPKQTLIRALSALTSIDEMKQTNPRSVSISVATKMCYRFLQRLITGVGLRPLNGQREDLHEREINRILNVFSDLGHMAMAHRIVALQERTSHAPPVSPVAYSILIKGYGRQGDLRHVEEVVRHAMKSNIRPDVVLLNSIIDAYNNCNDLAKAQAVFDQMRRPIGGRKASIIFNVDLPRPNRRSYNIMLKGFASIGSYDEAVALSEEMKKHSFWDAVTTNTLVQAAIAAKELDDAERILARYTLDPEDVDSEKGFHPNVEAYTQLLDCYAKQGDMNKALAIRQTMRSRGVHPNIVTYTCLVAGFGRSGQITEAKKLLIFMKQKGYWPSTVTYNALISALFAGAGRNGDVADLGMDRAVDDSLGLLRDMIGDNVRPDSLTSSQIVDAMGLCQPPRTEAAALLVDMLETKKLVPVGDVRLYTALIKTCGLADDIMSAAKYFRKLRKPDVIAINTFMHVCRHCSRLDLVKDTFYHFFHQRSANHKLKPDLITYSILIDSMLQQHADMSGLREVQSKYRTMKKKWKICPDSGLIDTILKSMIKLSRTRSFAKRDFLFLADILRDAERLTWPEGQFERRRRAIRSILGDSLREVALYDKRMRNLLPLEEDDVLFKRKGWNKVDSGFKVWGQGPDADIVPEKSEAEPVDEFLDSHGWNNVDSGFRLL